VSTATVAFRQSARSRRDRLAQVEQHRWRSYLRPHRAALTVASAVTVAETIFDLAVPWPLKLVVDNALGQHPVPAWLQPLTGTSSTRITVVAGLLTVLIAAASALCTYLAVRLVAVTGERIAETLREGLFRRLLTLDLRFHDEHRSSELVTRLTGDVTRVQTALTAWADVAIPQGLTLLGMAGVLLLVNPPLAAAAAVAGPPLLLLTVFRRRRVQRAEQHARSSTGMLTTVTSDVLRNVRAVTAFNEHAGSLRRFRVVNADTRRAHTAAEVVEARFSPLADVLLAAGTAAVLLVGSGQVSSGRISLGTMLVLLSYVAMMYAPIRSLARLGSTFARGNASRQRLAEVLDNQQILPTPSQPVPLPPLRGHGRSLQFDGLGFSYSKARRILADVSLTVQPGTFTCVVGDSGAGKTTLLSLALRLYDPDAGRVLVDGVDIRRLDAQVLRSELALVPQDNWLFDASLLDNLRWGAPNAAETEISAALDLCGLTPLVNRLPEGLATVIGEGGAQLSGGERRRLAIARALLRPANLLLLDEPTSGLDACAEADIVQALQRIRGERTIVAVSHQLTLARLADQVIVMRAGTVEETGTPTQLLAEPSTFRAMWNKQHSEVVSV
jgi:ABC-type multidrug transport system fused ATPase/permease subunit